MSQLVTLAFHKILLLALFICVNFGHRLLTVFLHSRLECLCLKLLSSGHRYHHQNEIVGTFVMDNS